MKNDSLVGAIFCISGSMIKKVKNAKSNSRKSNFFGKAALLSTPADLVTFTEEILIRKLKTFFFVL